MPRKFKQYSVLCELSSFRLTLLSCVYLERCTFQRPKTSHFVVRLVKVSKYHGLSPNVGVEVYVTFNIGPFRRDSSCGKQTKLTEGGIYFAMGMLFEAKFSGLR